MARKILSGILIALSAIFLVLSIVGIGAIWFYNEPLTQRATGQLKDIDVQLAQAQATLQSSEKELQRAQRFVDWPQTALKKMAKQTCRCQKRFDSIQSTIDDQAA